MSDVGMTPEQKAELRERLRKAAARRRFGTALNAEGDRALWSDYDVEYLLAQLEEFFVDACDVSIAGAAGVNMAMHALRVSPCVEGLSQEEINEGARRIALCIRDAVRGLVCMEPTDPTVLAAMDAVWDATTPLVTAMLEEHPEPADAPA
jgi:hypothetical protein